MRRAWHHVELDVDADGAKALGMVPALLVEQVDVADADPRRGQAPQLVAPRRCRVPRHLAGRRGTPRGGDPQVPRAPARLLLGEPPPPVRDPAHRAHVAPSGGLALPTRAAPRRPARRHRRGRALRPVAALAVGRAARPGRGQVGGGRRVAALRDGRAHPRPAPHRRLPTRLAGRPLPEREIAQVARDVDPRLLEHDGAAGARSTDTQLRHTIRATLDPWPT